MCLFCHKHDDYGLDHIHEQIDKASTHDMILKSISIKNALKNYEVWLNSDHLDGFERASIEQTVENLKKVQSILSRHL